jgi:hypothetical protein
MKTIHNNYIPFRGFKAINLFGVCFVRRPHKMMPQDYNHEKIHTAQMKELGYIGFYILYFLEWLVRLFITPSTAYRNISFEREAYDNQYNYDYLKSRKRYAQWRRK